MDAYVLEESIVDPPGWSDPGSSSAGSTSRATNSIGADDAEEGDGSNSSEDGMSMPRLRMWQANLNHKRIMHVVEKGELSAGPYG